ncbi:MAG: type II secretion system protein, partial [Flammeovirgaceae bacterium]
FNSTIDFNKGFTLAEISIVIMIIGLLVSGILVGQDMIRAAEMRSILTEKDKIVTKVNLFRNKYLALPGDMSNATEF